MPSPSCRTSAATRRASHRRHLPQPALSPNTVAPMSVDEPRPSGLGEPRLTPAQIERQDFRKTRKGLDEREVRAFLQRVADEFDAVNRRLADLEAQLRHPPLPSRDQLVEQVGQEVARALRERVLSDLNRRRDTLRAYIDQLREDRDRFAEAYLVVRDTVSDANEKLSQFGAGRPFPPVTADAGPHISYASDSESVPDHPGPRGSSVPRITAPRDPAPEPPPWVQRSEERR